MILRGYQLTQFIHLDYNKHDKEPKRPRQASVYLSESPKWYSLLERAWSALDTHPTSHRGQVLEVLTL